MRHASASQAHFLAVPRTLTHRAPAPFAPTSADAVARRVAAEGTLSTALGAQVAEAMSGRSRLDAAQTTLKSLQARLREIDALCALCKDLISHDDLIRQLATVRTNFGATLERATTILDLPEEAAETLAALEQEPELVVIFEELVALDAKCAVAQRLFEDGDAAESELGGAAGAAARSRKRSNAEHRARVASYFGKVDAAREAFEAQMWAVLRKAVHLGSDGACDCVRVVRVVQQQEAMDAQRAEDARSGAPPPPPRRYRIAALQAVERAVDDRCAELLPDPVPPLSQGAPPREYDDDDDHPRKRVEPKDDGSVTMEELMMDVRDCMHDLEEIHTYIVPCFPEDYNVWEVFVRRYHVRLVRFYDRLDASAGSDASNADILAVVGCHEEYEAVMRTLAVPPPWCDMTPVPLPIEPPPSAGGAGGKAGGKGAKDKKGLGAITSVTNTRDAVAAADADARARAKAAAAESGGNWEGAGVVPVDSTARALLTGIALDTAGLTVNLAAGLATGTIGVVKGVGNLVTGKGLWGASADAEEEAPAQAPQPKHPSAELWTPGTGFGYGRLLDLYVKRMRENTAGWMRNMVAADLALPPMEAEGGKLFTPAGVDFFRILNDQIEAVVAVTRGELLVRVVVAISALMLDFQRLQNAAVERPLSELSLEVLCAYVNNNERCFDLSNEMLESLKEAAPDEDAAARLDVLEITDQGFMDTARAAMKKVVDCMFADPGFASVFAALFASADWWSGATCDTLCATVVDYFGDLSAWLTESFFKRTAEAVMERTVASYCAALFVQCVSIKTGTMARIAADEEALRATFAPYCREAQLVTAFQTLTDLRDLACASTEAEISNAFGTMLTNAPGTTVEVVERILALRDDIPKPVKKTIVSACAEQWHHRNGTTAGGLAAAAAALGGATAATAAAIHEAITKAAKGRWFG